MRILLVEDDPELAVAVSELLRDEGYAVDHAADGPSAALAKDIDDYDLVVLDRSLPPPSGLTLLKTWREAGDRTPVLMLTARAAVEDRLTGLRQGADDYLTKPFHFSELLARVRSLLRRREPPERSVARLGSLTLDFETRRLLSGTQEVTLTSREIAILTLLTERRGTIVRREELLRNCWDFAFDSASNAVDVAVHRLRAKLLEAGEPNIVRTVRGEGYVLDASSSIPSA